MKNKINLFGKCDCCELKKDILILKLNKNKHTEFCKDCKKNFLKSFKKIK
jgi:hypothetical protein